MKHSRRTHTLVTAVVAACALLITLAPFGGYAGAQKTVPTKDGGQTTTEPDNSYGEGRTKDPPKKNVTPKEENSKQGPVEETPKQETLKQSVPRTIPTSLQETATAPLAGIPRGKRPILLLTENGQVVGKIVGPKGATDWEGFWGPNGGYVYFTKNGKEIPKTRVNFLGNINDLHFSPTGRFTRLPPIPAPPGANDVEMSWEDDRIVEAWWTRDGQRIERIPLSADAQEFHCGSVHSPL